MATRLCGLSAIYRDLVDLLYIDETITFQHKTIWNEMVLCIMMLWYIKNRFPITNGKLHNCVMCGFFSSMQITKAYGQ